MIVGRQRDTLKILQIGFGGFGPVHLRAWQALGFADRVVVADPSPAARDNCRRHGLADHDIVADYRTVLDRADLVDIVAPTDLHHQIAQTCFDAGRPVFLEKPMTASVAEARSLAERAADGGHALQVGYYFRYHPLALHAVARLRDGAIGRPRIVQARFVGWKRARLDSGALLNDAVHFIDLTNWLLDGFPNRVYAVLRDHFGRGFDDYALLVLHYPNDVVAHVEAGYGLPGQWNDNFVPGAAATKALTVAGDAGALEIDFHIGRLLEHRVRHRLRDGTWRPDFGDTVQPNIPYSEPVAVVGAELDGFLDAVLAGRPPWPGPEDCGIRVAEILQAALHSAQSGVPVTLAEKEL